tara:strand:+ start:1564 stop:1794 length:231 start_codon:yes stop_codon:yes gene_type:complete
MKLTYKIQRLFEQKKKVEKEIESIQRTCTHSKKVMKFVHENPPSTLTSIRWVCEKCEKLLLWPTDIELKIFLLNKR